MLMPGEHCTAYLILVNKMPVRQSLSFTIREGSKKTIARGIIREVFPPLNLDSFKDIKDKGLENFIKQQQ